MAVRVVAIVLTLAMCAPALGADEGVAGSVVDAPPHAPSGGAAMAGVPWAGLLVQVALAGAAVLAIAKWRLHRTGTRRLERMAHENPATPAAMFLLAALVLFIFNLLGGGAGMALTGSTGDALSDAVLGMAWMYGGFAVGIAVLAVLIPGLLGAIGWRAQGRDALSGLLGSAVIVPIVLLVGTIGILAASLVAHWAGEPPPEPTAHVGLLLFAQSDDTLMRVLFGVLVVVGAPIAEETMYRGLIQTGFLRASGSAWAAILATSAVFMLMHVSAVEWFALPAIFTLSVGLGVAAERTGRLGAPIVIHALFNLLNLVLTLAGG